MRTSYKIMSKYLKKKVCSNASEEINKNLLYQQSSNRLSWVQGCYQLKRIADVRVRCVSECVQYNI